MKSFLRAPTMKRTDGSRGYLLMECMVASAILAIAIGAVVGQMARARYDMGRGSTRDVAVSIAHTIVTDLEARPPPRVLSPWSAFAAVGNRYPGMEFRWRVQDANALQTITDCDGANLNADFYSMEAEVTYPVRHGSADDLSDGLADGRGLAAASRVVR